MNDLLSISVIIPNFNGGKTLQKCLQSLLQQDYSKLEILVIDGGSTDNSLEIIRKFEDRLNYWVSENDKGQSHAINKGIQVSQGDVINWLASDDELLPNSLHWIGSYFKRNAHTDVISGAAQVVFQSQKHLNFTLIPKSFHIDIIEAYNGIPQQSCFWRRRLHQREPLLDETYHYAMDQELWCYFRSISSKWAFTEKVLSRFNMSGINKTSTGGIEVARELERIYLTYSRYRIPLSFWYKTLRYPFECLLRRDRGWLRLGILRIIQLLYIVALTPFYGYKQVRYMSWPT